MIVSAVLLGSVAAAFPVPALALGPPRTLAATGSLGSLAGVSAVADPSFAIDYLGLSWTKGSEPQVRFRSEGGWTAWATAHEDHMPVVDGRTFSSLVSAGDADAFQVRGTNEGLRTVAINTSDGPRTPVFVQPSARASHLSQPAVISRTEWGADESYRFNDDGSEKWPPAFYPTQKLIVHHTATRNDDPDPAGTVRAIYRYHAIDKGWGDIGYNFLVDAQGRIYKGRYSGPPATWYEDTLTGEDPDGDGVTAAHTGGYNSGTMGIAVLGTYRTTSVSAAARSAIVDHLAWEAERHALDPQGSSTYTNPVNGSQKTVENISGHRDWSSTECPGDLFYADLPAIRDDVAAKVGTSSADTTAPSAPTDLSATSKRRKIELKWTASTDSGGSGLAGYEIWRATSSSGPFGKVATTTSTSYTDSGLSKRKTYWYYVTAYDNAGNVSGASNTVSATPL